MNGIAKKRRQKGPPRQRVPAMGVLTRELFCSQADPWSCAACVPDGSYNTGCFSIKQDYSLATSVAAGGTCTGIALNMVPYAFTKVDTLAVATTPTITGNWVTPAQYSSINALYGKYRPISGGLRGVYTGPTITDGGVIIVGLVAGNVPLSAFNGATIEVMQAAMLSYKIFPLRQGFKVTWRPEDIEDITQYQTINSSLQPVTATWNDPYLLAYAYGCGQNQSTLHIELVANFEAQYGSQTFMPGGLEIQGKPAEAGWYEHVKNALMGVQQITDAIPSVVSSANNVRSLVGLANGMYSAGTLARTALPRLGYRN